MPDDQHSTAPTLLWLRRDLRLADHPGWSAALRPGGPVIPVFILDPIFETYGVAPKWCLGESIRELGRMFQRHGSRLVLRRGEGGRGAGRADRRYGRPPRRPVAAL